MNGRGFCAWGLIVGTLALALGLMGLSTLAGFAMAVNGALVVAVSAWGYRRASAALLAVCGLVLVNVLVLGMAALARPAEALPLLGGAAVNALIFLRGLWVASRDEREPGDLFRLLAWALALPLLGVVAALATAEHPAWFVRAGGAATLLLAVAAFAARRPSLALPSGAAHWIWPAALMLPLAFLAERYILLLVHHYGAEVIAQRELILRAGVVERLVVLAGIVPIAEEVLFRGAIQGSLRERWGGPVGVLATSLLFTVIHGEPAALPVLFAAGLVLGLAREVSGSLYPGILAHALYNGLAAA